MNDNKKEIMFVDDEESILRTLKRQFIDSEYSCYFAGSFEETIHILEDHPNVELVITDVKMPGKTGIDLLEYLREHFPQIGRMILSGYVESAQVTRGIIKGTIYDFIGKPWHEEQLIERIKQYFSIRDEINDESIIKIINKIESLPVLPSVYNKFIEAVEKEKSIREIAKIVEKDVSISTKILSLSNKAYFGGSEITSTNQAIMRLGLNTLREIILTVGILNSFSMDHDQQKELNSIAEHAFRVNQVYMDLVQKLVEIKNPSSLGLFHDIGKIIQLVYFKEKYFLIKECMAQNPEIDYYKAEAEVLKYEVNHCHLGAYFLSFWGLPMLTVESALYHHHYRDVATDHKLMICLLHYADRIANGESLNDLKDEMIAENIFDAEKIKNMELN
ncbi:MAG: hypothetical protein Kow00108_11780 [Calditrichia bacterium]